jgi:putative PEP-CTERM system histidine kinase
MGIGLYSEILFATAAGAYAFLLLLLLISPGSGFTRALLAAALAITSGSAAVIAAKWNVVLGPSSAIIELARTGSWCGFVLHLLYKQRATDSRVLLLMSGCGVLLALGILMFALFPPSWIAASGAGLILTGNFAARLGLAVFGILLIENLYRNTAPDARWHVNLLCIAIGGMFASGIVVYADALLFRRISPLLWSSQAVAMVMAAPLLAVAAARNRDWRMDIHVSRRVVFHTTTLAGSGIFLLALALTGEIFRAAGPGWGELAEMTLMIAGVAILGMLLSSGSARSYLQRALAENFYSHRYDYREEWLKSIAILSTTADDIAVQTRVIRAVANIADSPAGVLWVRDFGGAAFQWGGSWNHPTVPMTQAADDDFVAAFKGGEWVIQLDRLTIRPHWLAEVPRGWLAVPLTQREEVIGFVVLTKPRAPFKLDRETFDLLRIVARQSAIHIAEQRNAQALADERHLGDYSKRFAFAVHDMKNVVGQLGLILQNAAAHQNDPEFQRDVLITVETAFERMQKLIARLRAPLSSAAGGAILPAAIIREEVAAMSRLRDASIDVEDAACNTAVAMDEAAFRSVITHLCENAIDAAHDRVALHLYQGRSGIQIDIADDGPGMEAEFVRDKLFRPLGSEKRDGFGIGAYQARELLRAAGGDLLVMSRPSGGTTMRIILPAAGELAEIRHQIGPVEEAV